MKWVKAKERLPKDHGNNLCNGWYFCKCEDDEVAVCLFKSGWQKFKLVTVGCKCQSYKEDDIEVLEWLDESEDPPKNELPLILDNIKQLKRHINKLNDDLNYECSKRRANEEDVRESDYF